MARSYCFTFFCIIVQFFSSLHFVLEMYVFSFFCLVGLFADGYYVFVHLFQFQPIYTLEICICDSLILHQLLYFPSFLQRHSTSAGQLSGLSFLFAYVIFVQPIDSLHPVFYLHTARQSHILHGSDQINKKNTRILVSPE